MPSLFQTPIINSAMDLDAYKLHMQQVVFERYSTARVRYRFLCRSDESLGPYLDEIREQVYGLEGVVFTASELVYLAQRPIFKPAFVDFLSHVQLNPEQYITMGVDREGQLWVECDGPWLFTIPFETMVLAIVSEVRNRHRFPDVTTDMIDQKLQFKIAYLNREFDRRGLESFHFADFGTRRRFSREAQRRVVTQLAEQVPGHFVGTSNYHLAHTLGLTPIGTMAHEYLQAHQALVHVADSQRVALNVWNEVYRGSLGVALTDCIDTDAFLNDFDYPLATLFSGVRHDSGNPIEWGERMIGHYQRNGIDPMTKQLVFSDGINFRRAMQIAEHFDSRAQTSFGIGTHLTNDPGENVNAQGEAYTPLNIVMKMVECNGRPVAKISNEPGKSLCNDPVYMAYLKSAFGIKESV